MALVKVIKAKLKRAKDKFKDLETLVNTSVASTVQKQEYVELKAKIEAYEDILDLAENMIYEDESTQKE